MSSSTSASRMSLIEERLSYLEQRDDANTRDILKLKSDNISLQNNIVELKQQNSKAQRGKKAAELRLSKLETETKDTICELSKEVFALRGLQRVLNTVLVKEHEGGLKKEIEKSVEDRLKTTNVTLSLIDTGLKDLGKEVKAVREKSTVIEGRLAKTEGDLKTLKNEENAERRQASGMAHARRTDESENIWHTPASKHNVMCGDDGRIRFVWADFGIGGIGTIYMQQSVSGRNNCFSIRVIESGSDDNRGIGIGLGPVNYPTGQMPGWLHHSIALHGDNGKLYKERGTGIIPTCGTCRIWKNGDIIKMVVAGLRSDQVIANNDTLDVTFFVNENKVAQTDFRIRDFDASNRMVFMVGINALSATAQILNFRP